MKRLLGRLVFISSFLLSMAIVGSYYLSFVSPERIGALCFVWFAFPYLWLVGLAGCVALIGFKQWLSVFFVVASMVLTWGGFTTVINFNVPLSNDDDGVRIMTYNVRCLNEVAHIEGVTLEDFARVVERESPDIVCLQEMPMSKHYMFKPYNYSITNLFKGYKYILTDADVFDMPAHATGKVILSKYPLTEKEVKVAGSANMWQGVCLAADVTVGDKIFTLYNCHLESIRLSSKEIEVVSKIQKADVRGDGTKENLRETKGKMSSAFLRRAKQVRGIKSYIDKSENPVIVCGDFNDTSISYTYQTLIKTLTDAFVESGNGWGNTYNGSLPPLRIDHMLYSKGIISGGYDIHKDDISDHFPVTCNFYLE